MTPGFYTFDCTSERLDGRGRALTSILLRLEEIASVHHDPPSDTFPESQLTGEIVLRSGHKYTCWARLGIWQRLRAVLQPPAVPRAKTTEAVYIDSDGRCTCNCGTACPLGRAGSQARCLEVELQAAGIPTQRGSIKP